MAAIKGFCPSQLSEPGRSYGHCQTVTEDQFQKELYRCLLPLLDGSVYLSPEYTVKGGGRVDFQIEERRWTMELLREGKWHSIREHCARFKEGGKYYPMIQEGCIEQFIVLNFTTSHYREPMKGMSLGAIVFITANHSLM